MRKAITIARCCAIPAACRERFVDFSGEDAAEWCRGGVHHAGVSDLVRGYRIGIPDAASIMLIATTAGAGWARTPDARFALLPGTLLVGAPGEGVEFGVDGERWSIVWWYIRPSAAWVGLGARRVRLRPWGHGAAASGLIDVMVERAALGDELSRRVARHAASAAWLLLRELASAPAPADEAAESERLDALWREVAERLDRPWPVAELARRMGMSAPSFQRLARRRLGGSAHRWLLRLRMERARQLLRGSSYPLRVVAEGVGYADPFTFSAAFRREHGRSPDAFRRGGQA